MPSIRESDAHPAGATAWFQGVLVLLVISVVWIGIGLNLRQERAQIERDAWGEVDNLARGFAESTRRTVEAADQVLRTVRTVYRSDPGRFDIRKVAPADQVLTELTLQVTHVDAQGYVVDSNLPGGRGVDLSDREHIRVHKDRADDFLFVSKPVLGRISGKWSLQFTRKLVAQDGSFAGVLVVSIDPSYISSFYNSLDIGQGSITLVGLDGVVRAHAPPTARILGEKVAAGILAEINNTSAAGHLATARNIDGVDRFYTFRRLDTQPLAVLVGLSRHDVFLPYERDVVSYLIAGTVVSLGVALIGLLLIRQGLRLQSAQAAFAVAVEHMAQGLMLIDREGIVRVINRRAIELLDLPPEIAKPGVRQELGIDFLRQRGEFGPVGEDLTVRRMIDSRTAGPTYYERTRPNGITLAVRTEPLPHGGAVRTFADVTLRKNNEIALAAARDAAERAQLAQAAFVATMSHEIRTPLNAISGLAGLLIDGILPAREAGYAATLREAADSLTQIVNDILDFSKLDAGRLGLDSVPIDLASLLDGVVGLMQIKASEKAIALRTDVSAEVPALVLGDPGRLRQVLVNLVGNALKFTSAGEVVIAARVEQGDDDGPTLHLAVRDTGIGIPPAAVAHVFDEFYQVDHSTARRFGGTGLGLAISRRLVEHMSGAIGVESVEGQGSIFHVRLPLRVVAEAQVREQAPAAPAAPDPSEPRRLRILLAEDNATNRLVAITRLEKLGHRVDAVANGVEAVEMVQRMPYDLVMMDVMMPEMDGVTATRAIRALSGPVRKIPIVAMTANVMQEQREEYAAAGMDGFIGKPFTAAELTEALGSAMSGSRA
ncbi:MAG: ATP-binding protein [Alphaproteobacteria bacterium]|nr:ATP-binding protein [Alphaproteobacteria bacterium]